MQYSIGDIVEVDTSKLMTSTGLVTTTTSNNGGICLYSKIDLDNYPSYNDFIGKAYHCKPGQVATITKYIGRPLRIKGGDRFQEFDVYEILIENFFVQIFAVNLSPINHANSASITSSSASDDVAESTP